MTMITIFAALLLLIGTANATESNSWPSFPTEGRFLEENDQFLDENDDLNPVLDENDDFDPVLDFGDLDGSYGSYDDDATTESATTESSGNDPEPKPFVATGTVAFKDLNPEVTECGNPAKTYFYASLATGIGQTVGAKAGDVKIKDDCEPLLRRRRSLAVETIIEYIISIAAGGFEDNSPTTGGADAVLAKLETLKTNVAAQETFLVRVHTEYGNKINEAQAAGTAVPPPLVEGGGTLEVASFSFVDETEYAAAPVPKSSDSGLSGGAIAGIVIACVVAVAAIVGAVVFVNTQETAASSGAGDGGGDDVFATTDKKSCQNDL